mgnify:CR=1 FL=1
MVETKRLALAGPVPSQPRSRSRAGWVASVVLSEKAIWRGCSTELRQARQGLAGGFEGGLEGERIENDSHREERALVRARLTSVGFIPALRAAPRA